jgi:hypothetical protein
LRNQQKAPGNKSDVIDFHGAQSGNGSSQEEYEESESDEHDVLTSSNENIPRSLPSDDTDEMEDEDDDDENATALGLGTRTGESIFTPQPNLFSHPPSAHGDSQTKARPTNDSYFPSTTLPRSQTSYSTTRRSQSTSNNVPQDHDAALRASLSTLLSCAAAARCLPKQSNMQTTRNTGPESIATIQAGTLRMVPDSLMRGQGHTQDNSAVPIRHVPSVHHDKAPSISSEDERVARDTTEKGKRKSSPQARGKDRVIKKTRTKAQNVEEISPTLLTWVVSAGVVVLVSAIGFSAGYAMGKEAGRAEAGALISTEESCGQEVVKGGLRRFRWAPSATHSISA